MALVDAHYRAIAAASHLPPDAARQLIEIGYVVIPGPIAPRDVQQLQEAYDRAVATADGADVRRSSSTRVTDFVTRAPEFDSIYVYRPLLAACCLIIGEPFKLSGTRARTLEPGAPAESLHVDVKHQADGWPIVGFIMMIDSFDADNGATRIVRGLICNLSSRARRWRIGITFTRSRCWRAAPPARSSFSMDQRGTVTPRTAQTGVGVPSKAISSLVRRKRPLTIMHGCARRFSGASET